MTKEEKLALAKILNSQTSVLLSNQRLMLMKGISLNKELFRYTEETNSALKDFSENLNNFVEME
jgi:hypothetical protein